jgi:hypothetical protein
MSFCLLPKKVEEFKKALKEKDIKLSDLVNMDSDKRTELLKEYAGDNAKAISTAIEEKLILKNRIQGLQNLIGKLTESGKYSKEEVARLNQIKSEYKAAQMERVFNPSENEAYLKGVAEKMLKVEVPKEVAQKVFQMTNEMSALKDKGSKMSGVSDEYLQKRKELNSYVSSFKNLTQGESIGQNLAIFGRNALLANPATPIKTLIGQTLNSVTDAITRRLYGKTLTGDVSGLAQKAFKEAQETTKKTGYNPANMESLDDFNKLGKGENFHLPTQSANRTIGTAENLIRNAAKVSNKVIIDWAHKIPFDYFSQKSFYDSLNMAVSDISKKEGLNGADAKARSTELFKDATKIVPDTEEGVALRKAAQAQVSRIVNTNDSIGSRISLGAKTWMNKWIKDFPLGDYVVPIAKIPANIIWNGLDNAGLGIPKGIKDYFEGKKKLASDDMETKLEGATQFRDGVQHLIRIGGSLTTAAVLASQLTQKDFKTDNYGAHFVKVGGTWVNMEYIAMISPALSGMMEAKKSGSVADYIPGTFSSWQALPGVDAGMSLLKSANSIQSINKYLTDFVTSRAEPAVIKSLTSDRPINRLLFGAHGIESEEQVKADEKVASDKSKAKAKANKAKKANQ